MCIFYFALTKFQNLLIFEKQDTKEDVHFDAFLKKLDSIFLNKMTLKIVSLGVWESKEIIYHYDFIPSSTLFRSMKFRIFLESEIVH